MTKEKAKIIRIVTDTIESWSNGNQKITALRMLGLNDVQIGEYIGRRANSVFGYRKFGYLPDEETDRAIDELLKLSLGVIGNRTTVPKRKKHPVDKILDAYTAYAKEAMKSA